MPWLILSHMDFMVFGISILERKLAYDKGSIKIGSLGLINPSNLEGLIRNPKTLELDLNLFFFEKKKNIAYTKKE